MLENNFKITNPTGLDAKNSSLLVTKASSFQCKIILQLNELAVDLKSIMGVMSLNVCRGEFVKIVCSGTDENDAMRDLISLINDNKIGKEY